MINPVRGGYVAAESYDKLCSWFTGQGWTIVGNFAVNPDTGTRWLIKANKAYSHWAKSRQ